MSDSLEDLLAGWGRVIATRDASPPDCECRKITGPLIAAWKGYQADLYDRHGRASDEATATQWKNLRRAQSAQSAAQLLPSETEDFILDVRDESEFKDAPRPGATNIPVDDVLLRISEIPTSRRIVIFCRSGARAERARGMLSLRGIHACNGHDDACPVPLLGASQAPDPRLGATEGGEETPGILSGLVGAATGAASEAGRGAAQGATEAVRASVPAIADAVRAEVPKTVSAVADSAKAEVPGVVDSAKPLIENAGESAGRGAARGAKDEAGGWGLGAKLISGAVAIGALLGIGYAVFGGSDKK